MGEPLRDLAAVRIHRSASEVPRPWRTSIGIWYVAPPTRRALSSTCGRTFSMALWNTVSTSFVPADFFRMSNASYTTRSDTDFLPSNISILIIFCTSRLLYRGSGGVSVRFPCRRLMPLSCRGSRLRSRSAFWRGLRNARTLRLLGAVLRPRLAPLVDARGVQRAPHDVIADAGQILHAPAAHQHDRVLLEIVPLSWNVGGHLHGGRQPDPGNFPQRGVGFFRRHRPNLHAHAAALRRGLERRRFRLLEQRVAPVADELTDRRHDGNLTAQRSSEFPLRLILHPFLQFQERRCLPRPPPLQAAAAQERSSPSPHPGS